METTSEPAATAKLVLLGDTQVGKSSTVIRFVKNEFDQYRYPTIGATFLTQSVHLHDYIVKFEIWDTAGQEKYRSLAPLYYRGANAALIVYDITNKDSFEHAKNWAEEVREREGSHVVIGLAGNKVDLEGRRMVEKSEADAFSRKAGFVFRETSAKTGEGILEIFKSIAELVPRPKPEDQEDNLTGLPPPVSNGSCC